MKRTCFGFVALALAGAAAAQQPSGSAAPTPDWAEVQGGDGVRAFVDRRSIRRQGDLLRYSGRILYPEPDENGVVELLHVGEIGCSARRYRTLSFEALAPGGAVVARYESPPEEPTIPINDGSNNDALHAEHCR